MNRAKKPTLHLAIVTKYNPGKKNGFLKVFQAEELLFFSLKDGRNFVDKEGRPVFGPKRDGSSGNRYIRAPKCGDKIAYGKTAPKQPGQLYARVYAWDS